ncbi:MAG: biotin/lipoyl-containing protein [Thermodesulfobacteriota bacterium]|nr:biotin/lipoyl-containing protein [Thermodesulfobacteriota bacterium]|tara:strand:- start:3890 stop:4390 length:501 start_codon:yes stop_codon:yes gene_type:complete
MKYDIKIANKLISFDLNEQDGGYIVTLEDKEFSGELIKVDSNLYSFVVDGSTYNISINKEGKKIQIYFRGDLFEFEIPSQRERTGLDNASGIDKINAPMPGRIIKLLKNIGDEVSEGEGLIVVEAMKMESELKTSISGKVTEINVQEGDTVELGAHLITVEDPEQE